MVKVIGYLGADNVLTDWYGNPIGTYRIVATWPTPQSYVSSHYHQVEACVDGIVYTGRSGGRGMVYQGRRKVRQSGKGY